MTFRAFRTALYKLPIKWPGSDQHDELQTSSWEMVETFTQLSAEFDDATDQIVKLTRENTWLLVALAKIVGTPKTPN